MKKIDDIMVSLELQKNLGIESVHITDIIRILKKIKEEVNNERNKCSNKHKDKNK